MSDDTSGNTVFATYNVRPGSEDTMLDLIRRHWPVLDQLGLVTGEPSRVYSRKDETGATVFVEIFTWKNAEAPGVAHHTPEVAAVWEPMGEHCEERGGRRKFDFPHYTELDLSS